MVPGEDPMTGAVGGCARRRQPRQRGPAACRRRSANPGGLRRALGCVGRSGRPHRWCSISSRSCGRSRRRVAREEFLDGLLDAVTAEGVRVDRHRACRSVRFRPRPRPPRPDRRRRHLPCDADVGSRAPRRDRPSCGVRRRDDRRTAGRAALTAEVRDRPGSLPLARVHARRAVRPLRQRAAISEQAVRTAGRPARLRRRARPSSIYDTAATPHDQDTTRALFDRLVTLTDEGGPAVRRRAERTRSWRRFRSYGDR